jgi:hypothetical protein
MPAHAAAIPVVLSDVNREQVLHQENLVPVFPCHTLRQ